MISQKFTVSIWFAILMIIHTTTVAGDRFVAGTADLPLLSGLYLVDEETVIFEKPVGRFVYAVAKGGRSEEDFWQFYRDTLPQLGWRAVARGVFVRDGESLTINVEKKDSQIIAYFTIAPASK